MTTEVATPTHTITIMLSPHADCLTRDDGQRDVPIGLTLECVSAITLADLLKVLSTWQRLLKAVQREVAPRKPLQWYVRELTLGAISGDALEVKP